MMTRRGKQRASQWQCSQLWQASVFRMLIKVSLNFVDFFLKSLTQQRKLSRDVLWHIIHSTWIPSWINEMYFYNETSLICLLSLMKITDRTLHPTIHYIYQFILCMLQGSGSHHTGMYALGRRCSLPPRKEHSNFIQSSQSRFLTSGPSLCDQYDDPALTAMYTTFAILKPLFGLLHWLMDENLEFCVFLC